MTISWSDLGNYKTYRVISPRGVGGVMVSSADEDDKSVPHFVNWRDGRSGWVRASGEIYTGPDEGKEVTILGELKLPQDMTAEDLDGLVFKTKDGGAVGFAGDNGFSVNRDAVVNWTSGPCPEWRRKGGVTRHPHDMADMVSQEYAAHVEQQKNPPVEIKWEIVLDNNGHPAHSACRVHGDLWQLWHRDRNATNPIGIYLNRQFFADSKGFGDAESKMLNHYKTTK